MIRINDSKSKTTLKAALVSVFLLFAAVAGFGQQQVNLSVGPATTTMPDGTTLPMWGYSCGTAVAGSTAACAPLTGSNPATSSAAMGALGGIYILNGGSGYTAAPTVTVSAPTGVITGVTNVTATATAIISGGQVVGVNVTNHGAGYIAAPTVTLSGGNAVLAASPAWSPVMITVPSGTTAAPAGLTINLTNNLSFTPTAGGTANTIPTSIVIVGQVGGGLGGAPTTTPSPSHALAQGCVSWFIASSATPPGVPCPAAQAGSGTPPAQLPRVQSMGAEVAAGATTATALTWTALKPGTYLLESGTHPSIQVPMGLIGVLVVTTAPSGATAGTAYPAVLATAKTAAMPAVTYNAELPLEFSEIDPVQNRAVDLAVRTSGFSETRVWSALPTDPQGGPGCGNPASTTYHTCYPPAVNYTPFYFLINGLAFDKANPNPSLFAATAGVSTATPPAPVTTNIAGTVLARLVNAGLRMHVPAIVGSQTTGFTGAGVLTTAANPVAGFTLIAEDGNPLPTSSGTTVAPRVKTEVFMAAGKTYDVMLNVPATATGAAGPPSLPIYDRSLALSANSSVRDAGMLAYISVNGALLPATVGGATGPFATANANPDTYPSISCVTGATSCAPLVISDPSKGVMANDINVYGVALSTPPANGTLTCSAVPGSPVAGICANGTFTYTPNAGATADSFGYCANGAVAGTAGLCTTVSLAASALTGNPTAIAHAYTAHTSTFIRIPSPGLLLGNSDPNNLPLSMAVPTTATGGVTMDAAGGFTVLNPAPSTTAQTTVTFNYTVQNSQGRSATGTATVTFPVPSNLQVHVLDAKAYNTCAGNTACISALAPFPDYRWIIEEDKTFWVDPNCTTNSSILTPGCPTVVGPAGQSTIPAFGVNFHASHMDFVAQGCTGPLSCEGGQTFLNPATGTHVPAVCDMGNGACRPDTTGNGFTPVNPSMVHLDPSKRYYISVLPGDAGNPFPGNVSASGCTGVEAAAGDTSCGHTMGGAQIPPACNKLGGPNACPTAAGAAAPPFALVNVLSLPTPLPTGKLAVIVFEDDDPLNGEQDGGGGNGTVPPVEPGLGGFNLILWDTYGSLGDVTGQDSFDMFNQPLSNSLAGTIDPSSGLDACPISATPLTGGSGTTDPTATGMAGMIVTCPKYESDGHTLSPMAGQAVIANLMPEKFSVQAYPGADRIARGEEWIQTNTLDGQHAHDSFVRIGEPSYFQEYGPAGYHVAIGFANPAIINARAKDVCAGLGTPGTVGACTNTIDGQVNIERLSRTPDQRLYASGNHDALAWTQCWISLGDPDGQDFMFTKCDSNGNFKFSNVPGGNWRLTIGDQWNDQIIDGLSTPANVGCPASAPACGAPTALHMGNIGAQQWQANLYTTTFVDDNMNGIKDPGEIGIPLIYTMVHYKDGHNANSLTTDFNGVANFNETFPLFNWYVVEADSGRYKTTGIHTVYDAGGPSDGSTSCGTSNGARACGTSTAYNFLSNTFEAVPLPADLSVPGAVYCKSADCAAEAASFAAGTAIPSSSTASTGRIDPPTFGGTEGWSGLTGQSNFIEIGKAPYAACPPACATVPNAVSNPTGGTTASTVQVGENGGIHGLVVYAATRPFDDASQMVQQPWAPNVPNVTVNLYQEGFAADGLTPTRTLVDTTQSTSWDAWAQGFYPSSTAGSGTGAGQKPYMSCPGQGTAPSATASPNQDPFYFTLFDQPNYIDWYNSMYNGGTLHTLPYNSQYKCYDSMHIGNQLQPAPYDGRYSFPSLLGINPTTGKPVTTVGSTNGVTASLAGTNCTICVANPDSADKYRSGTPMLPPGKYVVEVIMPPGYEVYKEEDKNLLIGDNYIAPVTQQFPGVGGAVFILPDQASVASMYDPTGSGYNPTNYQNQTTGMGAGDQLSLPAFPGFQDPVWPCVGEMRVVPDYLSLFPLNQETAPFAGATRPLCDRKEVTLANEMSVSAKFYVYTSTHIAGKYTGVITDDFTSEFDPFSPQFGEKFSPPNMPVSTKDYLGNETSRVYSDHWGTYEGLTFSSWEVNPPDITGYSPAMMVQCMNDPGPKLDTRTTIPNPSGSGTIPNPTYGQTINDPLYNAAYSNFCYTDPYMPGLNSYLDTPVVPTQANVGAGYNNADCEYPDATPAIKEVDGAGLGPWVSASGATLSITALGNQQASNSAYSGPSANVAPYNMKTVGRHYGFGARCISPTAGSATCSTLSSVTIGGVAAVVNTWSDTQIQVTVPTGVPNCTIQQQAQYGGSTAQCGELVITGGNGKQSIDTVTVTIGGKAPTHVPPASTIQSFIDAAAPGDMLIVDPNCMTTGTTPAAAACSTAALNAATPSQTAFAAAHNEMLIVWKPVRLQGVGAVNSVIDASAFPAGKLLDPWRRHINCLFGLTLQGAPVKTASGAGSYDPASSYSCPDTGIPGDVWNYFTAGPSNPQIDRQPLEAVLGWDATQNGNVAEQLQEPSLMGAYEGAGITVLAKGVDYHGAADIWTDGNEAGAFPTGTTLLTGVGPDPTALPVGDANSFCHTSSTVTANPFPSNFMCNPSSIDGLTVRDSSQGGGGIFIHGWAHHIQVANNRVYNNAGTLSGGISVGQGEFPPPYIQGSTTNAAPGSCSNAVLVSNQHQDYCLQLQPSVHNNYITNNSSLGDELFSGTLTGGGGVTFCTGNDYYKFNYNWVCGNLSSGEGGGVVHLGEIQHGLIEHNTIILNQSENPTIPTNGGGIQVQGTPDTDPICGLIPDSDCPPGLSDGTGRGLVINANLIQANMAESGSGGGIRLQQVNGTEVSTFPGNYFISAADEGHTVTITTLATATLPAVGDSVTIAGVSVAGYNGTFTVNSVGVQLFTYLATATGLGSGTSGTYTDVTAAGTAQTITGATETGPRVVTITSNLSPMVGDSVTITGVSVAGYNGTFTVTGVPTVGTFTYTASTNPLAAGTGGTITDSNPNQLTSVLWNSVSIINNMIVNNLAGWDGAGISLQDSVNVSIINNTVASNDSLASSGVLTQSIGTPLASAPPGNCVNAAGTTSCPQSSGVTSMQHSTVFTTALAALPTTTPIVCPNGQTGCAGFSNPVLANNIIWQNRSFEVGVGNLGAGTLNQQKLVSMFTASGAAAPVQTAYGQCTTGVTYWDLGVRGDTGPGNHNSGFTLTPTNSVLDDSGYAASNMTTNPNLVSQYCNGSRVPPTCSVANGCGGPSGYGVPPGIVDSMSPNPVMSLTPAATVDEGNNWINVSWGPLAMSNDAVVGGTNGNYGGGAPFANYSLVAGSPAIDVVPFNATTLPLASTPALAFDFNGNPRPDPSAPNVFDIGAVEFQGTSTGQAGLVSIAPNTGSQGSVVNVTITGTGLAGATAVTVANVGGGGGSGITVSNFVAVSATTVTATFTIAGNATVGARNVRVVTPGAPAGVGPITFSVVAASAATLTSITPNSELRGTSVNVTLTGTNFTAGSTVNVQGATGGGTGFSITNVTFVNSTTITATFTSTNAAALGAMNIYVGTAAGSTNTVPFTINGPVLTSISPVSGMRGNVIPVTLTGTGLTGTTAVNVSGNGVTVTGITVVSDTTVTATFTLSNGATAGARNVTTTGPGGTSNAVTFTITVPAAGLNSIAPNTGPRGTSETVTLTGVGFTGATSVNVTGGGITVTNFLVVNDTTITATFTISTTAALTARNVTVTTPSGNTTPVTFTVVPPGTPTLSSISPASGTRGSSQTVTLTGTGFTATGTVVHVTAPANGLTFSAVTVVNSTTITATFTLSGTATIGPRSIYVTTPGGTSGTVTYTVVGPVLQSISPVSAARGQTIPVSLFGSGLTGATAVTVSGTGITVSGVTPINDTQVNATFTISSTAAGSAARNVTVTVTPGGTSNSVAFTVITLPAPTLNSLSPAAGLRGTSVPITLMGNNLTGATGLTGLGGGVSLVAGSLKVQSPTVATATLAITVGATVTTRNIGITTGSGTSNTEPFAVQQPTVTSIRPISGSRGASNLPVTLNGTNLAGASSITFSGTGVTCSITTPAPTASTVNALCSITNAAGTGAHTLTTVATTANGNAAISAGVSITVLSGTVAFSAPAPAMTTTPGTTTAKNATITVSNTAAVGGASSGPVTLTANPALGAKTGAGTGTFAITGGTCTSGAIINPGGNCTITVSYTPLTTGANTTATATTHVSITDTGAATATQNSANFNAN